MSEEQFFVHTGDHVELAQAELRALALAYFPSARVRHHDRVSIVRGNVEVQKITTRAAGVRYAGRILGFPSGHYPNIDLDGHFKRCERFACRLINLSDANVSGEIISDLGKYIKEKCPWLKVSLDNPQVTVLYVITNSGAFIGLEEYHNNFKWGKKELRKRPFFHPVALNPKYSRMMVNLTAVKENDLLLDPFCGTGSIIVEAAKMGIRTAGCDLSFKMCLGSKINIKNEGCIVNSDALLLPFRFDDVTAMATDLPYGNAASTMKREPKKLLTEFVELLANEMKGKRCAVMCRKGDESFFDNIVEQYDIYEHKNLTRKLMVLCN